MDSTTSLTGLVSCGILDCFQENGTSWLNFSASNNVADIATSGHNIKHYKL